MPRLHQETLAEQTAYRLGWDAAVNAIRNQIENPQFITLVGIGPEAHAVLMERVKGFMSVGIENIVEMKLRNGQ